MSLKEVDILQREADVLQREADVLQKVADLSEKKAPDAKAPDAKAPDAKAPDAKAPDDAMPPGMVMPSETKNKNGEKPPAGGMAHDMNDSAMKASMEADIRRKFWVALAVTVIIVLLSPMGKFPGLLLPAAARSWVLLALTTPVVFWCGWMFISGAYQSLRSRKLDMSVLIAVGVLAAYLASVYLTVIRSKDTFYEAAAMLVAFVLFGHWMEMKSRRGTSDALQALFKLVPPKARVIRGGAESEVPTAEVVQGDLLALRPGDRIPVDGEITEGETAVDEALVTGESLPVKKRRATHSLQGRSTARGQSNSRQPASAKRRRWRVSPNSSRRRRTPKRPASGWPTKPPRTSSCWPWASGSSRSSPGAGGPGLPS